MLKFTEKDMENKYDKYSKAVEVRERYGYEVIYEVVVGSQAYGTNTPESDVDIKGVYIVDKSDFTTGDYKQQVELDKDTMFYEYSRFLHLLGTANPTVLEMLFTPADTIIYVDNKYMESLLDNKKTFLTKQCKNSFGGYGLQQIKKARGLDKKMNYEKHFTEEKTILDFMYVLSQGKKYAPVSARDWILYHNMYEELFGLVKLDHTHGLFTMYYDWSAHYKYQGVRGQETLKFKGLHNEFTPLVSSVPKDMEPEALLYWNMDAWHEYKKKHGEYLTWLKNRNTARYVDTKKHGQKIDGKNLLHAMRLISMARDLAITGHLFVRRANADWLLSIRRGEINLEKLLISAEQGIKGLDELFEKSDLPQEVDKKLIKDLILHIYN